MGQGSFNQAARMHVCLTLKKPEDAEYVILVRETPYNRLDEIILHELSHIARGDL